MPLKIMVPTEGRRVRDPGGRVVPAHGIEAASSSYWLRLEREGSIAAVEPTSKLGREYARTEARERVQNAADVLDGRSVSDRVASAFAGGGSTAEPSAPTTEE